MDTAILIAIISAVVALGSAVITWRGQLKIEKVKYALKREHEIELKKEKAEALFSKYRDPLIRAAFELQSRIYSIVSIGALSYLSGTAREKSYMLKNILYVIGQYFAWTEIIRREIRFLDLGQEKKTKKLTKKQDDIREIFLMEKNSRVFRVFRGEQRAIGECMIVNDGNTLQCIGFSVFVKKLREDEDFQYWFETLREDVAILAQSPSQHSTRLIELQHALVDLIIFLDPKGVWIPRDKRTKVG